MRNRRNGGAYVVCISNEGYPVSLIVRRIYRVLADPEASGRGLVRVVDESGEDYLYPSGLFAQIELPREIERRFCEFGGRHG
jgi:hypothetical protein